MTGQLSLFDFMPSMMAEPEVGEYVDCCGAVIPHIMRKGYIGKKVLVDVSTRSRELYLVGILEAIVPDHYWKGDERVECERSIVYTGKRQRSLVSHYPWATELQEVRPRDEWRPG